ncbi:MAG: hypothetical protein U5N53_14355 [Mycobacterium sp.]|nr:hypothetical protein [Mycobacterium sp.]
MDARVSDGNPRAAGPFNFAVTTERHDWARNTVGICSYCVHCCQLNEVMPIDRLGFPTRVIDANLEAGSTGDLVYMVGVPRSRRCSRRGVPPGGPRTTAVERDEG